MKPINIYWDSKSGIDDDPESRWLFDDEIIYQDPDSEEHFTIEDLEVEGELYKKFKTRYVKIKHAMVENLHTLFEESMFENRLNYLEFTIEYQEKIYKLKEFILSRKVVEIEQKGKLEQVLEVFERINTKNTKLSIFDIMVAKTYKKFDEGFFTLRDYIKLITNEAIYVDADYFKNLKRIDLDNYANPYDKDGAALLFLIMISLRRKFKATQILRITTSDLLENIKFLHFTINRVKEILMNNLHIEYEEIKKYQPVSKFITAFVSEYPKDESKHKDFIEKWFWNTLMYNRYPGAQNERIEKDFKRVKKHMGLNISDALIEMQADNSRNFDYLNNSSIENMQLFNCSYQKKSSQLYKAMLLVFKSNDLKDFYSGVTPLINGTKKIKLEEHHIFPLNSKIGKMIKEKYESSKYENIIHNIANLSLLTKETNNKYISNKNPSVYILEFENEFKENGKIESFYEYMKSQFITKDMLEYLKKDMFEEFLVERTKLIHSYINELTKI